MRDVTTRRIKYIVGTIGIIGLTAMAGIGDDNEVPDNQGSQSQVTHADRIQGSPSRPFAARFQVKFPGAEPVGH